MILLDTNVLSALMRDPADPAVVAWLDRRKLRENLAGRVAPLDRAAADAAGLLASRREATGRTVDIRDTLIGGVAIARRALVATRNLRHYADLDTGAVDPWAAKPGG